MRLVHATALAVAAALMLPAAPEAQTQAAQQMDANRKVAGGGITAPGWMGMVDPADKKKGESINNSKLMAMGADLHVQSGPASTYWNPKNMAMGNYMVSATFVEAKQINDHPHPYGVFIGGKDLDTATQSYLYCTVYGNGTMIVRGFNGEASVRYTTGRPVANDAIKKFAADGSVTQEVALRVTATTVDCLANGTVVVSLPKAEVVMAGKLASTDGIYGIRSGHNTDVVVKGLRMTKQ